MEPGIDKYRLLMKRLPDAFAYHQIITDSEGKPVDYTFLDVNPAFEKMTGLPRDKVIGRKVTAVLPDITNAGFDWIGTYGRVALDGETATFEQFSEPLDRWYEVTAYSDEPGYFAVLFRDITSSKKEKVDQELLLDNIEIQIWYLKDVETYGSVNQAHADFFGVSKEELENKSLYDLMATRDEAETCIAGNQEVFRQKHQIHSEELVLNGKGEQRLLSITKTPKLDDHNYVEYVVCSAEDITERKQAEEKLIHNEQRLSLAQTFAHTGLWEYDINNETLYWSKECETLFGLEEGEFEGTFTDFLKRVHPGDREYVISMNQPITEHDKGVPLEYEHRIIKKDGSVRWVRESAGVVGDDANNPVKIIGFVIDITESKNAENALREREEQLSLFFSQSLHGFFMCMLDQPIAWNDSIDKDKTLEYVFDHQRMTRVNQAMLNQYGATEQDFIGITVRELFQHDPDHAREIWRGLFDRGRWHVETHEQKMDGTPVVIDGDYICIYDEQGRITGHFGVQVDITEQKKAEQTLRESEAKYRQLIETLQEGIWVIDKDGYTTYANQVMADIVGYTIEEMLGKHLFEFIDEEQAKKTEQYLIHRMQGQKERHESNLIHKDGHYVVIELETGPILDEDGNYNGAIAGVQDITDRKRAEQALQEKSEELDRYFTSSLDLLCIANTAGEFVRLNPEWEKVLGYPITELEGRSFLDFVHPEDMEGTLAAIATLQDQDEVLSFENRYRCQDSSFCWIEWRSKPLGETIYAVARDITWRKQAEEALNYRLEFEQLVARISSKFLNISVKEINEGINFVLEVTGEFFEVDRSYVFQFSADARTMSNTYEWCAAGTEPQINKIQNQALESLPWWAENIRTHDYVHIPDVPELPPEAAAEREEFQVQGIQSLLCVPLRSKDRLIGFFGFDSVKMKKTWTEETISLLKVIADILVNAFEKNRTEQKIHDYTMELELKGIELEELYQQLDQELDKARAIHERTLPEEIPHIKGLSLHAYYQPAQRMGGDFYNVIQVNNKLILYVSDVSGHGLEGALLSAFVKEAIDSYVTLKPDELGPEKILQHLNGQYRKENYPADYFICIFLMVLDLNTMELTYTGLGFQELPLVQMGTGERLRLHTEGPPISSAIPEEIMEFTAGKIILSPGTTVLASTDGITEQQAGEEQYNGRLEQVFYEHSHLAPELIMNAVKEDFYRFNGGSMQGNDDITMGIIQVEAEKQAK